MVISNHSSFRVLFDEIISVYFVSEKCTNILASETASPSNRHCASCIGTLSFPAALSAAPSVAPGRCRISPPRFLAECRKRQLNQGSFVSLYFRLSTFSDSYRVCLSVFSCTVSFVSIGQVIGCEDRLRNDLYCVEWGVKLYSNQPTNPALSPSPRVENPGLATGR